MARDYRELDAAGLKSLIDQAKDYISQEQEEIDKLNKQLAGHRIELRRWNGTLGELVTAFAAAIKRETG